MIYLDNAATTPILPDVLYAMIPSFTEYYGNPSAIYSLGRAIRSEVEHVRSIIAISLGCDDDEIYFTSGATESNNWFNKIRGGFQLFTSEFEHPSIGCFSKPDQVIRVDHDGFVKVNEIPEIMSLPLGNKNYRRTYIEFNPKKYVSVMFANNEIGTIQPIEQIAKIVHNNNGLFHTDATQAYCHIPINVKKMGIDFLSASGHKLNAPKGIGFLYINKDIKNQIYTDVLLRGGSQEFGMRAGTENVSGIIGLGAAIRYHEEHREADNKRLKELSQYLFGRLTALIPDCYMNGTEDYNRRLSSNVNMRFDGIDAQELIAMLDEKDICVSAGSACHSGNPTPSKTLKAIGLTDKEAMSSVRFTLGLNTTKDDLDIVIQEVTNGVRILREYAI